MSRPAARGQRARSSRDATESVVVPRRSRSLARALGIAPGGVYAFVGAGGKTACIRRLLQECPRGMATTTTHLGLTGFGTGLLATFPNAPLLEAGFESLWPARPLTLAVQDGARLRGPALEWLESLPRQHRSMLLFVEADGASRRLLKLPASHEPAWPPGPLRRLVIVVGMGACGRPLAEVAHHPERFGGARNRKAGMHHVERMLRAYVEAAPPTVALTVLCTGVDGSEPTEVPRLVQRCIQWVRRRDGTLQDPGVALRFVAARDMGDSYFTVWDVPARTTPGVARFPGVCGVLLAAGLGARFRAGSEVESKLLVPWRGRPLVEHAAERFARAGFAAWIAVTGHAAPAVERVLRRVARRHGVPLRILRNRSPARGLGSSVRLAARNAPPGMALLFGHGDMPALPVATLRRIAATGSSLHRCIVVPEVQGKPANPVFFPADLRVDLQRVPPSEGGRAVIRAHPERLFPLAWKQGAPFRDIDSHADLQALRRRPLDPAQCLVLFIGCGDLGTGGAHTLARAGFPVVLVELAQPQAVRRRVSFAEAARAGAVQVEGLHCRRVELPWLLATWSGASPVRRAAAEPGTQALRPNPLGFVPLLVGSWREAVRALRPTVLVDARLAKTRLRGAVPASLFHVALGPGHVAGEDCDAVVETLRGVSLGRVIWRGAAARNTGVPGAIGGRTRERVLRAPASGVLLHAAVIGRRVRARQVVARIGRHVVRAPISGIVRGMLAEGDRVRRGQKLGDVDPRRKAPSVDRISDKSRRVGEGLLEAIRSHFDLPVAPGIPGKASRETRRKAGLPAPRR